MKRIILLMMLLLIQQVAAYPDIIALGNVNKTEVKELVDTIPYEYVDLVDKIYFVDHLRYGYAGSFDGSCTFRRIFVYSGPLFPYTENILFHEYGHALGECYYGDDSEEFADEFMIDLLLRTGFIFKEGVS